MATPVFVSFDYDNDRHYKYLLEAWHAHPRFQFVFQDETPREIDSTDVGRVKAALTAKINRATHTLVIVGEFANAIHRQMLWIGYRNWINFEIAQSRASGNKIVAVKLDRRFESPEELNGAGASWAMAFTEEAIVRALESV
jgi:Thoeris protein ThsB, TIR-like domain